MVKEATSNDEEEQMAACGACGSLLPMNSKSCPDCGVSFSGLNTDPMGECTACGAMNLLTSKQCWRCNIMFIGLEDVDGDGALDLVSEDTTYSEEKKAAAEAAEEAAAEEAEEAAAEEAEEAAAEEAEGAEDEDSDEEDSDEEDSDEEDSDEEDSDEEDSDEEDSDEEDSDEEDSDEEDSDEEAVSEEISAGDDFFTRMKLQIFPEPEAFPTSVQTKLSSKRWIDIAFPLLMAAFGFLLVGTMVNQFIGVPIDMDGDPDTAAESRTVLILQHFGILGGDDADTSIDTGMSFHFNTFILLISLLSLGISIVGYILAKGWRTKIIDIKKSESKTEESDDESDDESDEDSDEDSDDSEESEETEEESEEKSDDADDDDGEDEIDVGSRVGVSIEHDDGDVEEFYGVIIEFDDDNDEVVVKDEETDEEVIVPQDALFLD